jgi:DNA-binding FadR family transcriptional regulator
LRAASGLVEFAQALGLRHGPPVTLGFYDALIGALERGDAEAALLAIAPILQAERQRGIV